MSSLDELRAAPRERERLLVHADWLQARGDPRGELIAVQDRERHSDTAEAFIEARTRARALLDAHPKLRPPAPRDAEGAARAIWACWERGFIRRLELLVDRPSPGPALPGVVDGPSGWAELLAAILDHPALALVEQLVIRVELEAEGMSPRFIEMLAADLAIRGLERWLAKPGPEPALELDLWTLRAPSFETHSLLGQSLAPLRPRWFSSNITIIPPRPSSPASALDLALAPSALDPRGGWARVDLGWFDGRGQFLARLDADADVWRVHLRTLAERRSPPDLARADPLPLRRVTWLLDELGARYQPHGAGLVPAPPPSLAPVGLDAAIGAFVPQLSPTQRIDLSPALRAFEAEAITWHRAQWQADARPWSALLGLGPDQLLILAAPA